MRFVLDTQLYIEAMRSPVGNARLSRLEEISPFLWVSAVVMHELITGGRDPTFARERALLSPWADRGRVITPSLAAWQGVGGAIAALHVRRRIDARRVSKGFALDVLLAASCAEEEIILVTRNTRDFALIAEEIPLRFIPPWT
jgi:predicted nucleic acid-binding protein